MDKIILSENTYKFILKDLETKQLLEVCDATLEKEKKEYCILFSANQKNIQYIYMLIENIYDRKPNEKNYLFFDGTEVLISEGIAIKLLLSKFEETDYYPLKNRLLNHIIKENKIEHIKEIKELTDKPFSNILLFDKIDISRITRDLSSSDINGCIQLEQDVYINNRYISNDFEIKKGKVYFRNCIFEGNIEIGGSANVNIFQCIIVGNLNIYDASKVSLSSVNAKKIRIIRSSLSNLNIEFCKIYRFICCSCEIGKIRIKYSRFIEPYLANLKFEDMENKIDVLQFNTKNIRKSIIRRINNNKPIKIKNEKWFYFTFSYDEPNKAVLPDEIATDCVNFILKYTDLEKEHQINCDMQYKKAVYTNTKWRRVFVRLTGAFLIPSRWVIYLIINTILFTLLYTVIPSMQFTNIATNVNEHLDIWNAAYYSIFQIINSNPTNYSAVGITKLCTVIQTLLNTTFITNFFVAIIKKYIRNH